MWRIHKREHLKVREQMTLPSTNNKLKRGPRWIDMLWEEEEDKVEVIATL